MFDLWNLSALHAGRKRSKFQKLRFQMDALERRLLLSTDTWVNPAGGSWETASNWSLNAVPGQQDDAVIGLAGAYTVNVGAAHTVNSLTFSGSSGVQSLNLNGNALTLTSGETVATGSNVSIGGGTIGGGTLLNQGVTTLLNVTVNSPLDNQGTLDIQGSEAFNGAVTAENGSSIDLLEDGSNGGSASLSLAQGFVNHGTIDFSQGGYPYYWNDSLSVAAGTLVNASDGLIESTQTQGTTVQWSGNLDNQGTLSIGFGMSMGGAAADSNEGAIRIASGSLTLNGVSFDNAGTIAVSSGQSLSISGGTFTEQGSGAFSGAGSISVQNATIDLAGNLVNPSVTASISGSTINGPGTFLNSASLTTTLLNVTVNAPLDNQGTLDIEGAVALNGAVTAEAGSSINLLEDGSNGGSASLSPADGFVNDGTIDFSQGGYPYYWNDSLNVLSGTLVNAPGGLIEMTQTQGQPVRWTGSLDNQGTLSVGYATVMSGNSAVDSSEGALSVDASLSLNSVSFTNAGTIAVSAGQSLSVNGGTFTEQGGGSFSGTGSLSAQNATVDLAGDLVNPSVTASISGSTINGPGTFLNSASLTTTLLNVTVNSPLDNQGTLDIEGAVALNGAVTAEVGSQLDLLESGNDGGSADLSTADGFVNNGTIDFSQGNYPYYWNDALSVGSGTLVNAPGGLIEMTQTQGEPVQWTGSLDNQGTLWVGYATVMSGSSAVDSSEGSITLAGGSLTLNGVAFTNAGSMDVSAGQSLSISGGTFTEQGSGSFSGTGSLSVQNATVDLAGNWVNPTVTPVLTNVTVNGPGTFINAAGVTTTLLNVTVNAPLDNQGTLDVEGADAFDGIVTAESGSQIDLLESGNAGGSADLSLAEGFTNDGTIDFSQGNYPYYWNDALSIGSGTLVNASGGLIESTQTQGQPVQWTGSLDNQGTLDAAGAVAFDLNLPSSGTSTNEGVLESTNGGNLVLNGVILSNGSGALVSTPGATIAADGSVLGSTTNAVGFQPQGDLSFNGGSGSDPDLLEAMSEDLGAVAAGFQQNFAFGTLTIAGGYTQLVDRSANSPGGPDAVYAATLDVPSGATLDLNGLHLYTLQATIGGSILNGTVSTVSGGLPDLTPQSAVAIRSGSTVTVQWSDANLGGGALSVPWSDQVQLIDVTDGNAVVASTTVAFDESANGPIPAGGSVAQQVVFNLAGIPSVPAGDSLQAVITDDSAGVVLESSKSNNSVAINVSSPMAASLTVAPSQSIPYGSSLTLTGQLVEPGSMPAGEFVTVTVGSLSTQAALQPDGSFAVTIPSVTLGVTQSPYTLTYSYGGDGIRAAAEDSSTALTITPATLTVTANSINLVYGQPVPTLSGTVSGIVAGDGITVSYTTTAGAFSAPNSYPITPVLSDPDGRLSNYTLIETPGVLNIAQGSTVTGLTVGGTPIQGQPLTLTATVTSASPAAGTPTGQVQFYSDGTLIGSGALVNGVAAITYSMLAAGSHTITAQYVGDANFSAGSSVPVDETIGSASAGVTLNAPTTVSFGQAILLSAQVSAATPGGPVPTGTIQFFNGTALLGTAALVNGSASLTLKGGSLGAGAYSLTAEYSGDANNPSAGSSAQTTVITPAYSNATVSTSSASVTVGKTVTFTAFVSSVGTLTGSVTFLAGGMPLATVSLGTNDQASFATKSLAAGTYAITVEYSGDANHAGSTSVPVTQVISASGVSTTGPYAIGTDLDSGLQALQGDLGGWASLFNLTSALPVVGANLASLFGLSGVFGGLTLPSVSVSAADTPASLASKLQAAGITVTGLAGVSGIGSPLAGDLLDATWSITVPLGSVNAALDPGTASLLGGLASELGITGAITASGELTLNLAFGVNTSGAFFVAGNGSNAQLAFQAAGTLSSSISSAIGVSGSADIGSTAQPFDLALKANPASRWTAGTSGFSSVASGTFLNGSVDPTGTATETPSLTLASGDLTITGTFTQTYTGTTHDATSASLSGQFAVPSLQTAQGTPDTIALNGSIVGTTWSLSGTVPASDTLDGFAFGGALTGKVGFNTANLAVSGTLSGSLDVPLENDPLTIPFSAAVTSTGFSVSTSVTDPRASIGANDLLWLQNGKFGLSVIGTFAPAETTVTVSAGADVAVVLPQSSPATGVPPGAALVDGFTGSISSSGALSLSANSFTVTAVPDLTVSGGTVSLTINPAQTAPSTVIATLNDLKIQANGINLPVTVTALTVRRNGLDLVAGVGPIAGQINFSSAVTATLTGAELNLNLHLTTAPWTLSGSVNFQATGASISAASALVLSATGLSAVIPLNTSGAYTVTAGQLSLDADNVLNVTADNVQLKIGATGSSPVLSIGSASATIPALPGLTIAVTNLALSTADVISFGKIKASYSGSLLQQIGLGGLLPFDINSVSITALSNFATLQISVGGTFDFSSLDLPFTPTVTVGSGPANTFNFSLDLGDLQSGVIQPVSFGPITLGFTNLQLDPLTLSGSITLGGYQSGSFVPSIAGSFGFTDGSGDSLTASIAGTLESGSDGTTLDLSALFQNISFRIGQSVQVSDANLAAGLVISGSDSSWTVNPSLSGANIGSVGISLGNLLTLTASNVNLNFGPAAGQPLATFGSMGVQFNSAASLLSGWGGTATGFGINANGSIFAGSGAGIALTLPSNVASLFGLPSWIPFYVTSVGIQFEPGFFAQGSSGTIANPADIGLVLSGGIGSPDFPIAASVQGLQLSIPAILNGQFPFTSVAGGGFGVQPFTVGPVTIGGYLNFGQTDPGASDNIVYLDIQGIFTIPDLGNVGGRLIVSQYGPVALSVNVPLGIPFGGPTGLILTDVTGGLVFGQAPTTVDDAADLTQADIPGLPPAITTPAQIAALVEKSVNVTKTDGWLSDDSIALSADIGDIYLPGLVSATLGLSINTGGELAGYGALTALGFPVGNAAILLNLSKADDPQILANITAPAAGSPLGFLLPADVNFGFTLDGQGLPQAVILGLRTFLTDAETGTESIANTFIGNLLNAIAGAVNSNPESPLAVDLFGSSVRTPLTRATLISRLLALIPSDLTDVDSELNSLGSLAEDFETALLSTVGSVVYNPTASDLNAIQGLLTAVGDAGEAGVQGMAAFMYDMGKAEQAAAAAFISEFNPSISITGDIQPVVLGIPFGSPTVQGGIDISKQGVTVNANVSPTGILADWLSLASVADPQALTALQVIDPIPFGLIGSDHLDATLELPFSGSFVNNLVAGSLSAQVNPLSNNWLVSVGGSFAPYGIQLSSFTAAVFGANDSAASRLLAGQSNFANPITNPNKIYVYAPELPTVESLGGVILNSNLLLPELLFESPTQWLSSLPQMPSNPLQLPTYFGQLGKALGAEEIVGQDQAYIPSPTSLLNYNFTNYTSDNRVTLSSAFNALNGAQQQADIQSLLSNMYVEGFVNEDLLGIPLGNATVAGSAQGLSITGTVPWLADLSADFNLTFQSEAVSVADFETIMGRPPTSDEMNSRGQALIQMPVVGTSTSISSATLNSALTKWGLGEIAAATGGFSATFGAYSPGYDPASSDPVQQNGGFELSANLSIPGVLNNAAFQFALSAPAAGKTVPGFTATASAVGFTPIPGMTLNSGTITISNQSGSPTVTVSGTATLFGATVNVQGQLNPDFTGSLSITAQSGQSFNAAGLSFAGALTLKLTKSAGGSLAGSITIFNVVTLPTWLSAATGKTVVSLTGTVSSADSYSLSLGVGSRFKVGSLGIAVVGANGTGNAVFSLVQNAQTSGIGVSGALLLSAGNGLGLLSVSGVLNTGTGAGNLTVGFGSTGIVSLDGFNLVGNATLAYSPTSYSITVNGTLSIPGLLSNAAVVGSMNQNGISSLSVDASGLELSPITIQSAMLSLLRTNSTTQTYVLSAQLTADLPNIINNVSLTGTFASDGSGTLTLGVTAINLFGFSLTHGQFAVVRTQSQLEFTAAAALSFLGENATVSGTILLNFTGMEGDLSVTIGSGSPLTLAGWSVSGTFGLFVTPLSAVFTVTDAQLAVPGLGNLAISGSLDPYGNGSLSVDIPGSRPLQLGGTNLSLSGDFTLQTTSIGNGLDASFSAYGASVNVPGIGSLYIPQLTINLNGSFSASVDPVTINLGALIFYSGNLTFSGGVLPNDPSLFAYALYSVGGSLEIPAINQTFNLGTFDLGSDFNLVISPGLLSTLTFGSVQLTGELVLQDNDGVFDVAVQPLNSNTPPQLLLPGFGSIDLNAFTISSDGTFNVSAYVPYVGIAGLGISDATFSAQMTAGDLSTFDVNISGGQLDLPAGATVSLPSLDISSSASFAAILPVSSLQFGLFGVSSAQFLLSCSNGDFDFSLINGPASVNFLDGSVGLTLNSLDINSNGTFTGSVSGQLAFGRYVLASATFDVSLQDGILVLTLPLADAATINLGFATVSFHGAAGSDGSFGFSGTWAVNIAGCTGTATFVISSETGFSGTFTGDVPGFTDVTGSIDSSGTLTVSAGGQNLSFSL